MRDAIEFNIGGIKCDNKQCGYSNMDVKVEDYSKWVNKPCPNCGENLLTEADYNSAQLMMNIAKMFNKTLPKRDVNEEIVTAEVEMDGTGKINYKIKE